MGSIIVRKYESGVKTQISDTSDKLCIKYGKLRFTTLF